MKGSRAHRRLWQELEAALGPGAIRLHGSAEESAPASIEIRPEGREGFRLAVHRLRESLTPWQAVGSSAAKPGRVALSTASFGEILDLWPEDLVARIGAGADLDALEKRLAARGLRIPATSLRSGPRTLGGLFAAGERGWRGRPHQRLRESVLGITVVDGQGRVLKGGGRVMKNVAGYDLVRLHHGARGAFGVITDLTMRLEALPQSAAAFALQTRREEIPEALAARRLPAASMDPVVQLWLDGAAARWSGHGPEGLLVVGVEGWDESVGKWTGALPDSATPVDPAALLETLDHEAIWAGRIFLGPAALLEVWPRWKARWSPVEASLVVDLSTGHARVLIHRESPVRNAAVIELARLCRERGGALFAERERIPSPAAQSPRASCGLDSPGISPDSPGNSSGESAAAPSPARALKGRLKQIFDPQGLLPPLPVPPGGEG